MSLFGAVAARDRWLLCAFALTVFCGSFLLFLLEPIIAKELLPWFGGAANVWATCIVFFQLGLLLGYGYADTLVRRLAPRAQLVSLIVPLGAAALLLPIVPSRHWAANATQSPALAVLGALATTVGVPYVLMSATSPLIQSWYAQRFPGRSPYRLFALSNLASMLALLAYPVLIEPRLGTRLQAYGWSAAYGGWALLMLVCAVSAQRRPEPARGPARSDAAPLDAARPDVPRLDARAGAAPSRAQYLSWTGLAALGSFLLIAVTSHLTRDVAAIPLLWVVPLAVYLLTFIASFQDSRWLTPLRLAGIGLAALALYVAYAVYLNWPGGDADNTLPIGWQILILCAVLGGACLYCHGTVARTRPAPAHLTRFYLTVSLGGALGSMLVGLAAPALLQVDFDLEGGMLAFAAVVVVSAWRRGRLAAALGVLALVATTGAGALAVQQFYQQTVLARRNFYGSLRVYEWNAGKVGTARSLTNGVILHGTQYSEPRARRRPTEYYAEGSGVGRAIAALERGGASLRVGVIGLGVGTLAAYGRPRDVIRFYELNPTVLDIARREFTYLGESAARIDVVLGDARISLEREAPQRFDLIVVDAFSSDAIPVHLLTREALAVYLRHLRPGGVVAFHTSNRYVDLPPVVARLAEMRGLSARLIETDDDDTFNTPSSWVLVSADAAFFEAPQIKPAASKLPRGGSRPWTDDFSDLIEFMH
ncbi:MAG TPA: fused MFS/spermidine synthase [Steroidobacteraceae bacterium]|nr:fused MFS/spermidine synthase [Steroidobacteraceae bacterium]